MPDGASAELAVDVVSIHAPRCREAMRRRDKVRELELRFQSTPPVAGRRCPRHRVILGGRRAFQSTPPVAGRRCRVAGVRTRPASRVSIHAPRCREAMPRTNGGSGSCKPVSIHAPRCREAMPRRPQGARGARPVSIHAPRCREAMQVVGGVNDREWRVSIHAPRCREAMRRGTGRAFRGSRFNPRPPLPGGDAMQTRTINAYGLVSIHAPRCREAMRRI